MIFHSRPPLLDLSKEGVPPFQAIILAAGRGTRFNCELSKMLHEVLYIPMVARVAQTIEDIEASRLIVITGYQSESIKETLEETFPLSREYIDSSVKYIKQEALRGTGEAVWCAAEYLNDAAPPLTLILSGDVPNISPETLLSFIRDYNAQEGKFAVMTAEVPDPHGYGRIVRGEDGKVIKIVEEKDATDKERAITEINAGIYLGPTTFYHDILKGYCSTPPNNAQNEWYLTEVVEAAVKDKHIGVYAWKVGEHKEIQGVNTKVELAEANEFARCRYNRFLMLQGVTLENPSNTYIDETVRIEPGVTIASDVTIRSGSEVKSGAYIQKGCFLSNAKIGRNCVIRPYSVIYDSMVGERTSVGPFAYLRQGNNIGEGCRIGNFVEMKQTEMGNGSKSPHLTYLGDSKIGNNVNIGAGTITCNYDGFKKHPTVINDGAFIGSNSALVAPVEIGKGALVGAGSVITQNVPADALAIERSTQEIRPGYAAKRRESAQTLEEKDQKDQ